MKRIITFSLVLLSLVTVFAFSSCGKKEAKEEGTVPYKVIIDCSEIISNLDNEAYAIKPEKRDIVPQSSIILQESGKCKEGTTAYDLVTSVFKENKFHFDGTGVYFKGIGNFYEGDCGPTSGWMFFVNGSLAELGAADTVVNTDDVIEFRYIVDYNTLFASH
ncbi:MAG: DUF4430 domain-containing protein [Clostridia bacterium]|nr:DUF4430 domain-containing protein [Clostridia bacterium]